MSLLYHFRRRDISLAYFPHKHVQLTIQNKSVYNPHREARQARAREKTQEILLCPRLMFILLQPVSNN